MIERCEFELCPAAAGPASPGRPRHIGAVMAEVLGQYGLAPAADMAVAGPVASIAPLAGFELLAAAPAAGCVGA